MKKYIPIFCLLFVFTSCKKKILEIVPVLQIQQDISIKTLDAIKYFSFPSSGTGYAATDKGVAFIYKTTDGGSSWSKIVIGTIEKCNGLEFFDNLHGICLMDQTLYSTADGGSTWNFIDGEIDFIGKTQSGLGVYLKYYYGNCKVYTSTDKGQSFDLTHTIMDGTSDEFTSASISDNKLIYFTDNTPYNDIAYGFDFISNAEISIKFYALDYGNPPTSMYLSGGAGYLIAGGGIFEQKYGEYKLAPHDPPGGYHSVDGNDGFIICVGDKTITSNLDLQNGDEWNEVFDGDGNGFNKTFYKISFIDKNSFYLSGSNGYLIKAKI